MSTSRLCIKNLPKHLTNDRFRQIFEEIGSVTDAKIMNRNGKSRKFGFIGYKTAVEAERAKNYFNNTYIDTSKITIEYAGDVADYINHVRPWSKYSKGSSQHKKLHPEMYPEEDKLKTKKRKKSVDQIEEKIEKDPNLQRFLDVMKPRSVAKSWANDDNLIETRKSKKQKTIKSGKREPDSEMNDIFGDSSSDEEYFENPSIEGTPAPTSSKTALPDREPTPNSEDSESNVESCSEEVYSKSKKTKKVKAKKVKTEKTKKSKKEKKTKKEKKEKSEKREKKRKKKKKKKNVGDLQSPTDDQTERKDKKKKKNLKKRKSVEDDQVGDGTSSADLEAKKAKKKRKKEKKQKKDKAKVESDVAKRPKPSSTSVHLMHPERVQLHDQTLPQPEEKFSKKECNPTDSISLPLPDVASTGRLFVRNLPFSTTPEELEEAFELYGAVAEVHIALDQNKFSKGFAYIQYVVPDHAIQAKDEMDGSIFQGRLLHVLPARPNPKAKSQVETVTWDDDEREAMTYKKKLDTERKKNSHKNDNWNSLFVRADTAVSAMADKLNVKKSDILDKEGDSNMAVSMALSETQVIAETKKFLNENGIQLSVFEGRKRGVARSKKMIIVKNLPFSCSEEELRDLFTRYGEVGRLILPPSKACAIVEYLHPVNAKEGFRNIAYRKFQHVPLYLEWAPKMPFQKSYREYNEETETVKKQEETEKKKELRKQIEEPSEPLEGTTLYVKNLNFKTTEQTLKNNFGYLGQIRSVSIVKKTLKAKPLDEKKNAMPEQQSMGYGFIEFGTHKEAQSALDLLQGILVDGHNLELIPSNRQTSKSSDKLNVKNKGKHSRTKISVKNLAFQASAQDLRELFNVYGKIKRLRVPKKFDGRHRGFAFIEFVSKEEAESAFEALKNSHLYGRHLVLEWAKEDENLEELREKTKKQYEQSQALANAKQQRKIVLEDDDDDFSNL